MLDYGCPGSAGVSTGDLRWWVPCSNAYANISSTPSLNGRPINSSPTGSPSVVKPAGTVIAGNPRPDAKYRLLPPVPVLRRRVSQHVRDDFSWLVI